jgi:general stress protein 26
MNLQPQRTAELTKLGELIGDIEIAMLTTREADGRLHSRPLRTLQMDAAGALWFITSISSPKIGELDAHRRVTLSYCRPTRDTYVSVSGVTQILRDLTQARALWNSSLLPWVPEGVEDPELVLLKVTVEEAEYWDAGRGELRSLLGGSASQDNQKITIASDSSGQP